jgi:hypothetical protein
MDIEIHNIFPKADKMALFELSRRISHEKITNGKRVDVVLILTQTHREMRCLTERCGDSLVCQLLKSDAFVWISCFDSDNGDAFGKMLEYVYRHSHNSPVTLLAYSTVCKYILQLWACIQCHDKIKHLFLVAPIVQDITLVERGFVQYIQSRIASMLLDRTWRLSCGDTLPSWADILTRQYQCYLVCSLLSLLDSTRSALFSNSTLSEDDHPAAALDILSQHALSRIMSEEVGMENLCFRLNAARCPEKIAVLVGQDDQRDKLALLHSSPAKTLTIADYTSAEMLQGRADSWILSRLLVG